MFTEEIAKYPLLLGFIKQIQFTLKQIKNQVL